MLSVPILVRAKDTGAEGIMVALDRVTTPVQGPDGTVTMRHEMLAGVCWNDMRVPAVSMHSTDDLEWLDIPDYTEDPGDDEEEEEEPGIGDEGSGQ